MPHSFGYRAHTRDLFQKGLWNHGTLPTGTYLKVYRLGEIVDIKGDGGVQKGMPHRFYHGKTGVIWNVTPRAIGVMVNKQVGNRIIRKKIHVRIEHIKHSKCRQDFLDRVNENDKKRAAAKKAGKFVFLKRTPAQPRKGGIVKLSKTTIETLHPVKYDGLGL